MNALKVPHFSVPSKLVTTSSEYHMHPAIGSSSLKHMLKSPAHFYHNLKHPTAPTAAMELGTAIHEAILEPHLFADSVVMPKFEGTGMRAKQEQWRIENHGKRHPKQDDFDIIKGILEALKKNDLAMGLLNKGAAEESYFWQDEETGIICKCRPDYLREDHLILDIKSTVDASQDGFPTQVARLNYHFSAAMYLDGVSAVTGKSFDDFIILAIEKTAPYGMNIHRIDRGALDAGRMLYKRSLKRLKECRDQNVYPAYEQKILTTSLPAWAFPFEEVG